MPRPNRKEHWDNHFKELAQERNHTIIKMEGDSKKNRIIYIKCHSCGNDFDITGYNYDRAGGIPTAANFIEAENNHFFPYGCKHCKSTYLKKHIDRPKGEDHPNWQGGVSMEGREGYLPGPYKDWRTGVYMVYGGKCFLTGSTDGEVLQCHHLDSWYTDPDKRYEVSNGVLLDPKVHNEFHKEHGFHTTVAQFEHFASTYYDIKVFPWSDPNASIETVAAHIQSEREKRLQSLTDKLSRLGLTWVSGKYENKRSELVVYCPQHNKNNTTSYANFMRATYGVSCCGQEASATQTPPSQKGLKRSAHSIELREKQRRDTCEQKIQAKIIENRHVFKSGFFENQKSLYVIYCPKDDETTTIAYMNYMRNLKGLPCCTKKRTSVDT